MEKFKLSTLKEVSDRWTHMTNEDKLDYVKSYVNNIIKDESSERERQKMRVEITNILYDCINNRP